MVRAMSEPKYRVGVEKAARIAGVSRWTINRRIKAGKLSCSRNRQGHPQIDLAELARIFDLDEAEVARAAHDDATGARVPRVAVQSTQRGRAPDDQSAATKLLEAELERLRADLDRERERADRFERRYFALLEDKRGDDPPKAADKPNQGDANARPKAAPADPTPRRPRREPTLADAIDTATRAILPAWLRR